MGSFFGNCFGNCFGKCKKTDVKNASSSIEQKKASAPDFAAGKTHSGLYDAGRDEFLTKHYEGNFNKMCEKILGKFDTFASSSLNRGALMLDICNTKKDFKLVKERFDEILEISRESSDYKSLEDLCGELRPIYLRLERIKGKGKDLHKGFHNRDRPPSDRTQLGQTRFRDDA
jgi:hypothetical protein